MSDDHQDEYFYDRDIRNGYATVIKWVFVLIPTLMNLWVISQYFHFYYSGIVPAAQAEYVVFTALFEFGMPAALASVIILIVWTLLQLNDDRMNLKALLDPVPVLCPFNIIASMYIYYTI